MVEDRCAPAGITSRYQQPLGFVEQDVLKGIRQTDDSTVDVDAVGFRTDRAAGCEDGFTIDLYGPGFDELVTLAPRGDSGPGEKAIQPQARSIT